MAIVQNYLAVQSEPMLDGVTMRVVIGPNEGAPVFNMRIFEVQPGKSTPFHRHWWEHEVFILEGSAILKLEENDIPVSPGTAILVNRNEKHQFINIGETVMKFMCLVPQEWLENLRSDDSDFRTGTC